MKLLNTFKNIVDDISPEICWFTTFNLNVEILEKYVLTAIAGKEPSELKRAEDYEALNLDLNKFNIKIPKSGVPWRYIIGRVTKKQPIRHFLWLKKNLLTN